MNQGDSALSPSASGILNCLRLLAAEASALKLVRTLSAIEEALEMAANESGLDPSGRVALAGSAKLVIH